MHWFWRAATATLVGCAHAGLAITVFNHVNEHFVDVILSVLPGLAVSCLIVYFLPPVIIAVAVYGGLSRRSAPRPDRETHCRKCGYILRGISEPRCPECGERI